jgi:hypothetical protein
MTAWAAKFCSSAISFSSDGDNVAKEIGVLP